MVYLILEVLRMQWPKRWLSSCLAEYPLYRRNWFATFIRKVGFAVRKNSFLDVWCEAYRNNDYYPDPCDEVESLVSSVLVDVV
jgi:hypothetical protein